MRTPSPLPLSRVRQSGSFLRPDTLQRGGFRLCALCTVAIALFATGCGFALRGTQQLPFPTIALAFPPNSPLGAELARSIRAGTRTQIVDDRSKASAVLELLGEIRDRQVLTLNAQGRAVEYSLRDRLRFRLLDAQAREVIEATEVLVQRDISFNDSQRLSKESEEALLYRDMQSDLVQQLLRRVAAARPYGSATHAAAN